MTADESAAPRQFRAGVCSASGGASNRTLECVAMWFIGSTAFTTAASGTSFSGLSGPPRTPEEEIAKLRSREMHGRNWAEQYHNRGFVIREAVVDTDFEIPADPKPRDSYAVKASRKPNLPGTVGLDRR